MASFDLEEIMRDDIRDIEKVVNDGNKTTYMGIQWSKKWRKDIVISDINSDRLVHYNFDSGRAKLVKGWFLNFW